MPPWCCTAVVHGCNRLTPAALSSYTICYRMASSTSRTEWRPVLPHVWLQPWDVSHYARAALRSPPTTRAASAPHACCKCPTRVLQVPHTRAASVPHACCKCPTRVLQVPHTRAASAPHQTPLPTPTAQLPNTTHPPCLQVTNYEDPDLEQLFKPVSAAGTADHDASWRGAADVLLHLLGGPVLKTRWCWECTDPGGIAGATLALL